MVFCSSCGAQIDDHLNFCPKCGAKNKYKKELGSPPVQAPPQKIQEPVSSPPPDPQPMSPPPPPEYEVEKTKQGIGVAIDFARRGIEQGVKFAEEGIETAREEIEERFDKDDPSPSPPPVELVQPAQPVAAQSISSADPPKKKFCPRCGYEIVGAGKFCSNCGNSVG